MGEIFEGLGTVSQAAGSVANGISSVLLALAALFGLLYCFFGFKLMRLWFAVCGFLLGAAAGFVATSFVFQVETVGPHIFAALAGGVLGALLLYKVYLVGVFLLNGSLAFLVFVLLLGYEGAALAAAGVCAVACGVLAVKFVRVWTIFSTGVSGGLTAGASLAALLGVGVPGALPAGAVIAALGIVFQWKTTGKAKKAAAPSHPAAAPLQTGAGLPAAVLKDAPAVKGGGMLLAFWGDPKKRILVCACAGVLVVLAAAAVWSGGRQAAGEPPTARGGHADLGYKAADGKDIARSALWLDADSVQFSDMAFTPQAYYAGEETAAVLAQWDDYDLNYGLIDRSGAIVASGYEKLAYGGMVEGEPWFACASNDGSFFGYIDARGARVLDLSEHGISTFFCDAMCFSDGVCIVMENGYGAKARYGIIDTRGDFVVPFSMEYEWVFPPEFSEGYAMASVSGDGFNGFLYGLIDSRGREVVPCEYDGIGAVHDGKVIAWKDRQYGALYTDGRVAEPFVYESEEALAVELGWADEKDLPTEALKDAYRFVEPLGGGLFAVGVDNDDSLDYYPVGIVDYRGKVIVEPEHRDIQACEYEPGLFQVRDGGTMYFCDGKGTRRTPDLDAADSSDPPIFRLDGDWGVLPRLLTEQESLLQS